MRAALLASILGTALLAMAPGPALAQSQSQSAAPSQSPWGPLDFLGQRVAPGQTLNVAFKTTSTNLYMNVVDSADTSGAAVHRGEVDGPTANLTATKPTIYVIQPFQPRAPARRDEAGSFEIAVTRK